MQINMTTQVEQPNSWKNTKLTQDETDKKNSPVSTKIIKYIIKNLPNKKTLDNFTDKFYLTFRRKRISILYTFP